MLAAGAIATGIALLGAFDAPSEAATPRTPPIVGHVYRSVSVEQEGRPMPLFDGAPVWLSIERRSIGVHGGCNGMAAALRVTPFRLRVSDIAQTAMGCLPAEREQRDDLLLSFFGGSPKWRLRDDRLELVLGATTMTLERDDLPPALPRTNPARPRDLIDASLVTDHFQRWPQGIGEAWGGPVVTVDVIARDGRTFLTMRTRCRRLEAPIAIHRATLTVGAPRTKTGPCRPSLSDEVLSSVRPFFGGKVMWHLDGQRLTLQRGRSTLELRVR